MGVVLVLVYIGFGIVLPVVFLLGNRNNASAQVGGIKLTAAEKRGRELFGASIAGCATRWPRPTRSARWAPTST